MFCSVLNTIKLAPFPNRFCHKVITASLQRKLSSSNTQYIRTLTLNPGDTEQKKRKKTVIPKITLIIQDDISVTTLEEAQKLSKRRDLKLVKVIDLGTKTQRPVYKLMTGTEYHAEDLKHREQKKKEREEGNTLKGEKVLILSSNITEHDLKTQVNKLLKWISKKYEVRVVINGEGSQMEKVDRVYKFLEENIASESRIVQKRTKGSDVKFQVLPPKKSKQNLDDS